MVDGKDQIAGGGSIPPEVQVNNGNAAIVDEDRGVTAIKLRVQQFFHNDPELWFFLLESQFESSGIRSDRTKYHTVIANLSQTVADRVRDVIRNPPDADKYNLIKARLIKDFADSETTKLKKLLSQLQLGDQRPSSLLQQMISLAGGAVSSDFVKTLWIERLPKMQQAVLVASRDTLAVLSEMADRMHETSFGPTISAFDSNSCRQNDSPLDSIVQRLDRFDQRLSRLENGRRDATPSRSRSTAGGKVSENKSSKSFDYCWWHFKFGSNAKRSKSPCKFKSVSEN